MTHRTLAWLSILAVAFTPALGLAEDKPDAKTEAKPKGPRYVNKEAGVAARGPEGWRMKADAAGPVEWSRLVTFYDSATDADIVLSVRKRTSSSASELLAKVRKEWAASPKIRVTAMRSVPKDTLNKVPHVLVDATYTVKPKAKTGEVPLPPVPYAVNATYFLGADGEYLLYAKAQRTHWSRILPKLREVRSSVQFARGVVEAPKTGGEYENQRYGFKCVYPDGAKLLTTGLPHVIAFVPKSSDEPRVDVYRLSLDGNAETDAKRLVTHYVDEQGGEAELGDVTVSGREGVLVKATAEIGGVPSAIRVATFRRNDNKTWRIRMTGPAGSGAKLDAALKTFLDTFKLTRPNN